jgi:creatinine amidohydrolase
MQFGEQNWPTTAGLTERIVVLPLGSLEQHGHHLPLLTDSMIGAEIARRAEAELGDSALFLPTLWVGASHHHLHFPGTISASSEVYIRLLTDMVESLITAGFRKIFLLNAHAGNIIPAQAALHALQIRYRKEIPELFLVFASWFEIAVPALAKIPGLKQDRISHACEWETSAIQAIRPELVDIEAAEGSRMPRHSAYYSFDFREAHRVFVARTMEQGTASGAFGWPETATVEKGEAILAVATEEIVAFLREFATWQPVTPRPPTPQ